MGRDPGRLHRLVQQRFVPQSGAALGVVLRRRYTTPHSSQPWRAHDSLFRLWGSEERSRAPASEHTGSTPAPKVRGKNHIALSDVDLFAFVSALPLPGLLAPMQQTAKTVFQALDAPLHFCSHQGTKPVVQPHVRLVATLSLLPPPTMLHRVPCRWTATLLRLRYAHALP